MSDTPITVLHDEKYGITFHKTAPLRRAGYTSVEQLETLVRAHRDNPEGSTLSSLSGMGPARVEAVCRAIDIWDS